MLRSPTAAARRGPTSSSPHFATQEHPENRPGLYSIFPNLPLAAGEPLTGIWPVNHRLPLSDPAKDLGFEFEKAQGVI